VIITPINAEENSTILKEDLTQDTITITEDNIQNYFDNTNSLNSSFENKTIKFKGEFDYLGTLNIDAKNTTLIGDNETLFTDTVFSINADFVTLSNVTLNLTGVFEDNDYSGIFIYGNDVTVSNVDLYYVTPKDVSACGINANFKQNIRLLNNTIYFDAHNNNDGTTRAINVEGCYNATIANNTLEAYFPLRTINFETGGVNHVLGICIEKKR
jgi:hypothetical protein